jgi:hypothetical protein
MSLDDLARLEIRDALLGSINADGGWGYYAGHTSRLEPTCWALAGLRAAGALEARSASASRNLLTAWQQPDGLLSEPAVRLEKRPNLAFNGLAAWLLLQHLDLASDGVTSALMAALCLAKGVRLPESTINRQDDTLQGWAWIDGTFSWVEPTCWGLIALKAAGSRDSAAEARVKEAERLLADRCCPSGGWNYGNSNMLGQSLHPYVSTTALGLVAMKDRGQEPCVERSLRYLKEQRLAEPSAMALGLTLVALRTWGVPAADVESALLAQWRRTRFLGNAHLMGLALYSLG